MKKGITLLELVIACILLAIVVLAVISIDTFSRYNLITADHRARLQNEISFVLEHMTKSIQQGVGNVSNKPIEYVIIGKEIIGFRVRVDPRPPSEQTPADLGDDLWYSYVLKQDGKTPPGYVLRFECSRISGSLPTCPASEDLATHIIGTQAVQSLMPAEPAGGYIDGYYVNLTESGSQVEVGLIGRWKRGQAKGPDNPQVEMKTKVYATRASVR